MYPLLNLFKNNGSPNILWKNMRYPPTWIFNPCAFKSCFSLNENFVNWPKSKTEKLQIHKNRFLVTLVTQIYVTSEEEIDSPESKSVDQLITFSTETEEVGELKRQKPRVGKNVVSAKTRIRNRVDVAEFRKASEEDLRSAKGVRRLRKKVS